MVAGSDGKWAMVTGASRGIGRATALALADDGWNVVVHCRSRRDLAESVVESLRETGRESFAIVADLEDVDAGPRLVSESWERTGGLDVWAHLAGADLLTGSAAGLPFERKLELATRVDLWGAMLVCRSVGKRMHERGNGVVLTVGWDQSATGMDGDSGELFAAIKGGVAAFSRSLAKSLAPRVRVNCVAPGWIKTAWGEGASDLWQERVVRETPLRRWGTPEDVAQAIAFLASDRAGFLTGQVVNVNGGAVTS